MSDANEFPSAIEIEGLTCIPWKAKAVEGGHRYRVEAVASGRGMLDGVPIVFYSTLPKPQQIEAMMLREFRHAMEPCRSGR